MTLKAVRFDPEQHAELIEFVENYRDKKNKPNHSEAIRFLMQKGLEAINGVDPNEQKEGIDIESLKSDILNQLMSQMQHMNIPPPQQYYQPVQQIQQPIQNNQLEPVQQEKLKEEKPLPKSINTNPLLANILSNANR